MRPRRGGEQWRAVVQRPLLPLAVFLNIFAWALSTVSLPFYVRRLSADDPQSTLRWVGWILGVTPLLAVSTTPLWMRMMRTVNPRTAFVMSNGLQGIPLFGLPLVQTIPYVFAMRAFLGLSGPSNTFAMLPVTGWILFATGIVLTVGPLAGPALSERFGEVRVVVGCVAASSLLLAGVGLATDLWAFAGLWLLHVLAIAPLFSIVTARVAVWTSGQALGLVNIFRVLATFFAPVAATTLLSWSSAPVVFAVLGALGCASLLAVYPSWKRMCAATPR